MGPEFGVRLASSNAGKIAQFQRNAPGIATLATEVLFHEDEIKRGITATGFEEIALISRGKFKEQRDALRQTELDGSDYEIIVSDSVVMIPRTEEDGKINYQTVHRNISEAQKVEALEEINRQGEVMFVGSVTFGRKNGESSFTVLTYCSCPIPASEPLDNLPVQIEQLPQLSAKADKPFEVGFIECIEEGGQFIYRKKPKAQTYTFDSSGSNTSKEVEARPYISGLTPDVIGFAESAGRTDRDISPIIQRLVGEHPFNTLTYHALWEAQGKPDLLTFYKTVLQQRSQFFDSHGGNCSFFTLGLVDYLKEQGISPQILLYPSSAAGGDKDGHSGVLFRNGNTMFFADPGLTIPWVIPIDSNIPVFPFEKIGDKRILVQVNDQDGDLLPDITMVGKNRLQLFRANEVVSPDDFSERLPAILVRLHQTRNDIKLDIHDHFGLKQMNISISRATGRISLGSGTNIQEYLLTDFLSDREKVKQFIGECALLNIDGQAVFDEIALDSSSI